MRYILYARKSSETEDRQVQSIPDQTRILRELAAQRGFPIIEEVIESKSAKDPGGRPEFQRMLTLIEKHKADAILCWSVNRLSRNPIDSGKLSWMLMSGTLQCIQTPEKVYLPEDNVLLFSVETATATQYILDLRKSVKRGIETKLREGWFPHRAPEGYLNDLRSHTILRDPERFDLVQRAWRLLLNGNYPINRAITLMNEEWGYLTRQTNKSGGRALSRSAGYRIFTNSFYAGYFQHNGITYQGKHEPMISMRDFEQVQRLLHRQMGKSHQIRHEFAYTGLIKCAKCGGSVTAELQKGWHYYHCINRSGKCNKRSIREDMLEQQINDCLKRITITEDFKRIVQDCLEQWLKDEFGDLEVLYQQQQRALWDAEKRLNELVEMRLRQLLDDIQYREKQKELQATVTTLRLEMVDIQDNLDGTREIIDNAMTFRVQAQEQFLKGEIAKRREIANCLGVRYVLDEREVFIEMNPLLSYMIPAEISVFELRKSGSENKKDGILLPSVPLGCDCDTEYEQIPKVPSVLASLFLQVWKGELNFPHVDF